MRLKSMEGPLAVHNGNGPDLLNSPKRINTVQNSNIANSNRKINSNIISNTTTTTTTDDVSNTFNVEDSVQWCTLENREITNNVKNRQEFNINNTLEATLRKSGFASSICSESSPDDSLLEYEEVHRSCSSLDVTPQEEDVSDCESIPEEGRGIINPNYPGFQHLAHTLNYSIKTPSEADDLEYNNNNNNNEEVVEDREEEPEYKIDSVNRLDSVENIQKVFYDKPVFNIPLQEGSNSDNEATIDTFQIVNPSDKVEGVVGDFEKEVGEELARLNRNDEIVQEELKEAIEKLNTCIDLEPSAIKYQYEPNTDQPFNKSPTMTTADNKNFQTPDNINANEEFTGKLKDAYLSIANETLPNLSSDFNANSKDEKLDQTKEDKDKEDVVPRKKEKVDYVKKRRDYNQQFGSLITVPRLGGRNRDGITRRTNSARDKKKSDCLGGFDVYNIETAMPKIDLDAIESHLKAAREEERRRHMDREEIRRRLAMGSEDDYFSDRPGRKPSLQARLQSGMNLQICFMNETASDTDSPSSDSECPMTNPKEKLSDKSLVAIPEPIPPVRPVTLSIGQPVAEPVLETNFFTRQARLQTEARMALAQAKEMARMQMEIERQRQIKSPITEMVRHSLEKVGISFPEERRRLSRQILTEMNVAQLQVIVNDLHTQIETLNEVLVKFLMERDDLHMEQDSMLVDIEDLTRYLGAKEQNVKTQNKPSFNNNTPPISTVDTSSPPRTPLAALNTSMKPHLHRIANLVKK